MALWAIVPAAGIGRRLGSAIPKQYLPLAGKPVLQHSLEKLQALPGVAALVVALNPQDSRFGQLPQAGGSAASFAETTTGGASRQHSVLNGLAVLAARASADDWVLVHDAVRPCVLLSDIHRLLAAVADHRVGGLLAVPQDNTLKRADASGHVAATVDRRHYWQALTPQVFRFGLLQQAMTSACEQGLAITDEASALEASGHKPLLVPADSNNIKITREADLVLAAAIMDWQQRAGNSRDSNGR